MALRVPPAATPAALSQCLIHARGGCAPLLISSFLCAGRPAGACCNPLLRPTQADLVEDVCVADTSRRTVRSGALLLAAFAAVLLICIFGMTWIILTGVHSRIDRLSEHVSAHSVRSVRIAFSAAQACRPMLHKTA